MSELRIHLRHPIHDNNMGVNIYSFDSRSLSGFEKVDPSPFRLEPEVRQIETSGSRIDSVI